MKQFLFILLFFPILKEGIAQDEMIKDSLIAHVRYLSSNELKGRGNYSRELITAAFYLSDRFDKAGLHHFPGFDSYLHSFAIKDYQKKLADSNHINYKNELVNVIGVLPGSSRPSQAIIISAHYDHIGKEGTIYNGANDNASGVAVMLALLDHFAARKNIRRTIIFCAFAGEELGLYGSEFFTNFINADSIVAVVNFDMVGIPTYGKNKFVFTGEEYSDLFKIFRNALSGENMKPLADPDPRKSYFTRSDNYPFARLGIPAHTIMATSDTDPCYHASCDEFRRINFDYMLALVKAFTIALEPVVDGTQTPKRIKEKFAF